MRRPSVLVPVSLAAACLSAGFIPTISQHLELGRVTRTLEQLAAAATDDAIATSGALDGTEPLAPDPTLFVRLASDGRSSSGGGGDAGWLASWQTIGGCGAGAGAGSSAGLKWIGRNVRGGLFNVQEQVSYTNIGSKAYPQHNFFVNTLISTDLAEKWTLGVVLPFVYKWLSDPMQLAPFAPAIDYSNGGLGDVSIMGTRRLGAINNTSVTGVIGLPTGKWNATWPSGAYLSQGQQVGFGRPTAALVVDHTMDEVWGLFVVGATAAYRGGKNELDSYRSPTAAVYGYTGYYLGPFVPAIGLTLAGFQTHDRDLNVEQATPLASLTANVSVEWSTDWIALMAGAQFPYKYDGLRTDAFGSPRSPWGFMPWIAAIGVSVSPF